jgi:hypothetical protein
MTTRSKQTARRRKPKQTSMVLGATGSMAAFAKDQHLKMLLPGVPAVVTTTAAGSISYSYPINPSGIGSFGSRFANTWNNCRILAADFEIIAITGVAGGSLGGSAACYFDERVLTVAPTATVATEAISSLIQLNSAGSKSHFTMKWKAKELNDLMWQDCGAPTVTGNLNIYRDVGFYGTAPVSTAVLVVRPMFLVEFKTLLS